MLSGIAAPAAMPLHHRAHPESFMTPRNWRERPAVEARLGQGNRQDILSVMAAQRGGLAGRNKIHQRGVEGKGICAFALEKRQGRVDGVLEPTGVSPAKTGAQLA